MNRLWYDHTGELDRFRLWGLKNLLTIHILRLEKAI